MDLAELVAHAAEKFKMREQHKWAGFPGFSVLTDPATGKWVALLMRQWDFDTGTEIQRCDIKCGRDCLTGNPPPYLSLPFRMKGPKWVGVCFDSATDPVTVCRLFDKAVYDGQQGSYTVVLQQPPAHTSSGVSVVLPPPPRRVTDTAWLPQQEDVPEKIRQMRQLYQYSAGSFAQKCRSFYLQARFMEDYTDDYPCNDTVTRYFPTYQDLNVRQLRGYFTWRTRVRQGEYRPIAPSLACLYLYELLNGIGAGSPREALARMRDFETGFLDAGYGEDRIRKHLHQWMLEFAIIHDLPPEEARQYADPALLERDAALDVLRSCDARTDGQVFDALDALSGRKLAQSPVVRRAGEKGMRLFARVWRCGTAQARSRGDDLFTACFGERQVFPWRPLESAVYWQQSPHPDTDYALDACRTLRCRRGYWREQRYENLYFDWKMLRGLLRRSDQQLRRALKTGHYLRESAADAWAAPLVEAALAAERQAEQEAARPRITIDLTGLDRIRQDAARTCSSLLAGEEADSGPEPAPAQSKAPLPPAPLPGAPAPAVLQPAPEAALDRVEQQVLQALLQGQPVQPILQAARRMPSVVADGINAALFDAVGDNVLDCDGGAILLVEDYRQEVQQLLAGSRTMGGNNP